TLLALRVAAQERPINPVPPIGQCGAVGAVLPSTEAFAKHPLAPDVLVFHEAVKFADKYCEYFDPKEQDAARKLVAEAVQRGEALAKGEAPWASATGLVARGYRSKIDDSIQPYGLVIPPSWSPKSAHRWRLDVWFHGRGEKLSEVNFLTERM